MKKRNTKQKRIILDTIRKNKTHPTIKELYQIIAKEVPDIGQATVYRNVSRLVEEGKIKKFSLLGKVDHYDGDPTSHYHLFCKECGKIIDCYDNDYLIFLEELKKKGEIEIEEATLLLTGKCKQCRKEKK